MPRRRAGPLPFIALAVILAALLFFALRPRPGRLLPHRPPPSPAPSNTTAGRPLDPALVARLEPLLGNWLDRWQLELPGFSLSRLRAAGHYEIAPLQPAPAAAPDFAAASLHRREALGLISYSPDRTRCVDRNAYAQIVIADGDTAIESEPDQLVELLDLRLKARTRLAFHGTAGATDAVFWLDDSTIVLCGRGEDHSGDRLRILPELRLVRLNRRTVTSYSLP